MSDQETCPLCDTPMLNAPGIGPFCPNKDCEVSDGADLYDRATKKKVREVFIIDETPPHIERAAYRKGMLRAAELADEKAAQARAKHGHPNMGRGPAYREVAAAIRAEAEKDKP